ncbi:TPA: Chromate resistance protein ChrB [Klebsiella pneumoniae]
MSSHSWLLISYKVPSEPARRRVALWRKLKTMGAVYIQNGVCLLPRNEEHTRQLKIIENEIGNMDGECVLLDSVALDDAQQDKVIARFQADREEEYTEFLGKCQDFEDEIAKETADKHFTFAELEENDVDLKKLQSWLDKIMKLDFYHSPVRETASERLKNCESLLEEYAQKVFEASDDHRQDC